MTLSCAVGPSAFVTELLTGREAAETATRPSSQRTDWVRMIDPALIDSPRIRNNTPPTECRRGHTYTDRDFAPDGRRICRKCKWLRACLLKGERGSWNPNRNLEREAELRRVRRKTDPSYKVRERLTRAKWASKNKPALSRYAAEQRRKNPKLRLTHSISQGIRNSLLSGKDGVSWVRLVGYDRSQLVVHLERQFLNGMNWENYGQWHIDHIIPVASFSFTSAGDEGFKACWAITNLRPLWAVDNLDKAAKRLHLI